MKLKWQQAEIAIELCDRVNSHRGELSESELDKRNALREAITILNKRGM